LICAHCRRETYSVDGRCPLCGASLAADGETLAGIDEDTGFGGFSSHPSADSPTIAGEGLTAGFETGAGLPPPSMTHVPDASAGDASGPLTLGQNFGDRYHIVRLLGLGGMGAVYQAWDAELGVVVALKVIRPEAGADPQTAQVLERRFKQELLLARQVTHKNVVRIHDLGEIQGIKYITMPYLEGEDLSTVLKREGRLPVARTLRIARSVVSGLAAAHAAGVVHRDLKPANIMVGADAEALIMDFGIARSIDPTISPGASGAAVTFPARKAVGQTVHGAVVGTVEYMAPEQARAQPVDHRADIYAFGLILYDMLLGRTRASRTDSVIAELNLRMKEPPPAPRTQDPTIPEALDHIVSRCIEPDADKRFATTRDLVAALDRLDDDGKPLPIVRRLTWRIGATAVSVFAGLLVLTWWLSRGPGAPVQHEPVPILIADFKNPTGDQAFEGALEDALSTALEGAGFITSYDRAEAHKIAARLWKRPALDDDTARLIANREGLKVVLAGSVERAGQGFTITVKGHTPGGAELWTQSASAASRTEVLRAVASVASDIRSVLGDTASRQDRRADSESVTTVSLEALQGYTVAQQLYNNGKFEDAVKQYNRSIEQDPNFGRAYAGLANTYFFMGRKAEAEQNYKKALSLMDRMTEREKYRTQGTYFFAIARNYEQAIDNYEKLLARYPTDSSALNNLAVAYFMKLNFAKAQEAGRRSLDLYPRNVIVRNNYALYAMYASDFDAARKQSEPLLRDPGDKPFFKIYLPAAIAAAVSRQFTDAANSYAQMAKAGPEGASLAATGLADLAVYRGRFDEAEEILKVGLQADLKANNTAGIAAKQIILAETYASTGRMPQALTVLEQALKLGRSESILVPAARLYVSARKIDEASDLAADLDNQLQTQARAYAKIIDGNIWLMKRRRATALDSFRDAKGHADFWMARLDMGITYVQAGAWAEALSELEECERRRGEATAIFLDDTPSVRYLGPLPYWLARAQEGVGQQAAAMANYKAFLAVRAAATTDPLVVDARKRAGQ
jgi:tetratricopeptide (TPR) repeat protein